MAIGPATEMTFSTNTITETVSSPLTIKASLGTLNLGSTNGDISIAAGSGHNLLGEGAGDISVTNGSTMGILTGSLTNYGLAAGVQVSDGSNNVFCIPSVTSGFPAGCYFFPAASTGTHILDAGSTLYVSLDTSSLVTNSPDLKFPDVASGTFGVITAFSTGHALCEKTDHSIGHCTTVVSATGTCTCT